MKAIGSPDAMDDQAHSLPLVTPLNWLALLAVALLLVAVALWGWLGSIPRMVDGRGVVLRNSEEGLIRIEATLPGVVERVDLKEGDLVEPGQAVAMLRGLGHSAGISPVIAARGGKVVEVIANPGRVMAPGDAVARMESTTGDYEVLLYVSAVEGKRVREGMEARILPAASAFPGSYLKGRVSYVSPHPVTQEYLHSELGGNVRLADWLLDQQTCTEVVLELLRDPASPDGYAWSGRKPGAMVESGLLLNGRVIFARVQPISWLLSSHRE